MFHNEPKQNINKRCSWAEFHPLLQSYHDTEWGEPVHDDTKHFEFLVLDAFQAGLSWLTILKKREHLRQAFAHFNYNRVAQFTHKDVELLLKNEKIIRNRLKIEATINNARKFLEIIEEFGSFDSFIWSFSNNRTIVNCWGSYKDAPAKTELSDQISKTLLEKGFKFVGSTICYAYMQAAGIVNDHETSCFRYRAVGDIKLIS